MYHLILIRAEKFDGEEVIHKNDCALIEEDVGQYNLDSVDSAHELCASIVSTIDYLAADAAVDAETPPDDGSSDDLDAMAADAYAEMDAQTDALDEDVARAEEQSIIDETLNRR